ncbi:MAG TPA: phytanoyl-CoA dioxygenase family protein [Methylomirabilota bacterium]
MTARSEQVANAMRGLAPGVCWTQGRPLPDARVGELHASRAAEGEDLGQRLADDGYVFLRGALDPADVRAARLEVLERLVQVGEIRPPAAEGIATGESRRAELVGDLGAFWKSVSEGPALRRVTHGPRLHALLARIAGAPVRAHDYMFLRAAPVGRTTGLHFDAPFFTRATERVYTAWVPLGDVPATDGPLVIAEGSHRFTDLHAGVRGFDVVYDTSRRAQLAADFGEFAESRDCRLLTADFRAGDICVFGMLTLHGSLDNHSPLGRVRLSCDVRYQPAAEPIDPRYFGPNPGGTTGAGYGELNGAKPLTQAWHVR